MSFVLRRMDLGLPHYFVLNPERIPGMAGGSWSMEKKTALRFARQLDGDRFVKAYMMYDAPFCETILYDPMEVTVGEDGESNV